MLYHLLLPFVDKLSLLNVFKYITFRSLGAAGTSLILSLLVGPWFIRELRKMSFKQVIREEGPDSHYKKSGTPTMGGVLILFSLVISSLLWINYKEPIAWILLFVIVSYGVLGWVDDYKKIIHKNTYGVSPLWKIIVQVIVASIASLLLIRYTNVGTELYFPFFKGIQLDLGWFYIPFSVLVILSASNAVNLTDGLDGLAIGTSSIVVSVFIALTYLAGNAKFSSYLDIPYIPGAGELTVVCSALAAAGLGFLWFNTHPAEIFMGDVGSLSLGGGIGVLAVATKNELLLLILGGIFVLEALSVIIQVLVFRKTGKRVFLMAPIHHHFEMKGIAESKITVRFWIISILLAIVALFTLKLR